MFTGPGLLAVNLNFIIVEIKCLESNRNHILIEYKSDLFKTSSLIHSIVSFLQEKYQWIYYGLYFEYFNISMNNIN